MIDGAASEARQRHCTAAGSYASFEAAAASGAPVTGCLPARIRSTFNLVSAAGPEQAVEMALPTRWIAYAPQRTQNATLPFKRTS
jgi:hypothetical protein